jgi:hypothetical protein
VKSFAATTAALLELEESSHGVSHVAMEATDSLDCRQFLQHVRLVEGR